MAAFEARVYAGFGSTWLTPAASIVWTEITSWVSRSSGPIRTRRGRSTITQRFDTGTVDFPLRGDDRRFDREHATGPLAAVLKSGVPVKATLTPAGGVESAIGSGFNKGWPQRPLGARRNRVPVQTFGIFSRLSRARLPGVYDQEVLADAPVAYWKLDDSVEAEMLDSSGNQNDGVHDNPEFGQDPLVADGGQSIFYDHVGDHRGKILATLVSAYPFTLEAWVKFSRDLTQHHSIFTVIRDTAMGSWVRLACPHNNTGLNPGGCLSLFISGGRHVRGATRIDDDEIHHVVGIAQSATSFDLYMDGVAEAETTLEAGTGFSNLSSHRLWSVGNYWDTKFGDFGLGGLLDNVAIYDTALSAARVLAHYEAGSAPLAGQRTDQRIGWVLDAVGVPADRRDLETGRTVCAEDRATVSVLALDYMRLVEATEDGRLFETADGKVRFLDRHYGRTATEATVPQLTIRDDPGMSSLSAADVDDDDELVVNVAVGSRQGGTEISVRDQASIDEHGEFGAARSGLLQRFDSEVRSLLEHIVALRATPQPRLPRLRLGFHTMTAADQAKVLALEIGHMVRLERTPQGVGAQTDHDLIVEGVEFEVVSARECWVHLNVSTAPDPDTGPALWGSSNWGQGLWAY